MSADNWGALVVVLVAFALACALAAWARAGRQIWVPTSLVLLAAAGAVAATPETVTVTAGAARTALVALGALLAVKGLGRYPELRAAEDGVRTGAAERFIIGTFVSVLRACACAGVVVLVRT